MRADESQLTSAERGILNGARALLAGDYATVLREWQPLAEQGNSDAQHILGSVYAYGLGVKKDYKTALALYRKAAEQGNGRAQFSMGQVYLKGEMVPPDYGIAMEWFRRGAAQGNDGSQLGIGTMYASGLGVERDYETAVKWFRLAAEQGNASAEYCLGMVYEDGLGVSRDDSAAAKWYRRSAKQMDRGDAQQRLGRMYAEGRGVPQDARAAIEWFRQAAEQGHAEAQFDLGAAYAEQALRAELPSDFVNAYMWLEIAALSGDSRCKELLDSIAEKMMPEQISVAAKLARDFVRKAEKEAAENPFLQGGTAEIVSPFADDGGSASPWSPHGRK